MIWPRRLLWIDAGAGLTAGIIVLLAATWLSTWYNLPLWMLHTMGVANLVYGAYSLQLAMRQRRPRIMIGLLILGNATWVVICLIWAFMFSNTASIWGLCHLTGEALFVGFLASLEWRWRELLLTA